MSQYIVDINTQLDELADRCKSSGSTEGQAIIDHIENLQEIADEDDLSRADFMALIASSTEELIKSAIEVLKIVWLDDKVSDFVVGLSIVKEETERHGQGCICADCSGAELTSAND